MHLLIPFAAAGSEAGRAAARTLTLPHLAVLMARSGPPQRDEGDELSFSPPHERALAAALGLAGADGCLPWGAWWATQDGRDPGDLAWALLTPAHWQLGSDQVTMTDPAALRLDEAGSRALLDSVHDLFESEGFVLVYGAPLRWYLAHESLIARRTASLDRVIGRSVDPWLTPGADGRLLRRLQNECQMRWHQHPLNEAREARGELAVNSFWLSGCGLRQPARTPPELQVDEGLRGPALAEDWPAWCAAWQALDAGPLAALCDAPEPVLTLCGEAASARFDIARPRPWWQRLASPWRQPDPRQLLESL